MQLVEDAPGSGFIGRQPGSSQEQDSPRGGIQFGVYNSLCRNTSGRVAAGFTA